MSDCKNDEYDNIYKYKYIKYKQKYVTHKYIVQYGNGMDENYEEIYGNLFNSKTESIAHCISSDVKMGKGIAAEFRKKYGGIKKILDQKPTMGNICVLRRKNRWIYYLITKEFYWEKPTYDSVKKCLENMKRHMEEHGVKSLAMPQIGCGLDKLKWESVRKIIKEIFPPDCKINITIYILKK